LKLTAISPCACPGKPRSESGGNSGEGIRAGFGAIDRFVPTSVGNQHKSLLGVDNSVSHTNVLGGWN